MGINYLKHSFKMQNNQQKVKAYGLRTSKVSSAPQVKLARIRVVRKAIAKVLTVLHEKRRDPAKTEFANKKYTPRDLRAKSSKAKRNQMTKHCQSLVTTKHAKRAGNFRQRRYAVVKA